jgi:3-hydroxyisobutyrate dehydrogenase-like beta-hydroxyacid dehydrogenase
MASNPAPKGFDARVYDLDPKAMEALAGGGAKPASSCREVGEHAEVLSVCVPADAHVEAVRLGEEGALAAMAAGSVIAIHSTVQPATIERMAAAARERGVDVIDACVTGGRAVAEAGELTLLIGGDPEALEKARPVLEAYGTTLLHAGPLGSGAKLKLAVNLLTYVNWAAAAESFRLAKASGLDPDMFIEAVISNGQVSEMRQRFIAGQKLPDEAAASEAARVGGGQTWRRPPTGTSPIPPTAPAASQRAAATWGPSAPPAWGSRRIARAGSGLREPGRC